MSMKLKLSAIFSDGMIMQREKENKIYGIDTGKASILKLDFLGKQFETAKQSNGQFIITLPPCMAGGPYEMTITGSEVKTIRDIWIGDVYLLSGQSNMELPVRRTLDQSAKEIEQTNLPLVRQFLVPLDPTHFDTPQEHFETGAWLSAEHEHIMEFSGAGLFFAKEMYNSQNVAVGLLMTAVGGSRVESWMDEESLIPFSGNVDGNYQDQLKKSKDSKALIRYIQEQEKQAQKWRAGIVDEVHKIVEPDWEKIGKIHLPTMVAEEGIKDFYGSILFYKEIEITDFDESKAFIYLGAVIESDEVWINGKLVGTTAYRYPPRKYKIGPGILKRGKNLITVRIEIESGNGGFVKGMPYYLDTGLLKIDLATEWYYEVGHRVSKPKLPVLFPPELPLGMFNSAIAPLKNISFRSVLWYQGESNGGDAKQYLDLFGAMVNLWRKVFGWEVPFFTVQLSSFQDPYYNGLIQNSSDRDWGEIRDNQRKAMKIKGVYLITAIDVGELADLHPQNKKAVGIRLANAVKKELFGEETHYEMPVPYEVRKEENGVVILFLHMDIAETKEIRGFEAEMESGEYVPLNAFLNKNKATITFPSSLLPENIDRVVYAWKNGPDCFDLRNEYGVVSGSFSMNLM